MEPGNVCHSCLEGYMEPVSDEEMREWRRGYFGYASGMMSIQYRKEKGGLKNEYNIYI